MARKTTGRAKMPKFKVGPVNVRAVRGPKDGAYYWRWTVYRDGRERGGALGWAKYEQVEALVIAKAAAGEFMAERRPTLGALPATIGDLMECWIYAEDQRRDIKASTKKTTLHFAEKVVRVLGDIRIHQMQFAHLESYRDERIANGTASNSVNHEINVMRRAWNWGRERGYCPDRELHRPNVKVKAVRAKLTPTLADARKILSAMDQTQWPFVALLLIAETGMRIGEIADLRWKHMDFRRQMLHVPETGKNGTREVVISEATTTLLKARMGRARQEAHVLGVAAGTVRTSLSQRYLPRVCEALNLPEYKPHGFRRLAVDSLYDQGVDPTVSAAMLGHSPQTAGRYYRRATLDRKRKAAEGAGLHALSIGLADGPSITTASMTTPTRAAG